jgi:hypothetical protein
MVDICLNCCHSASGEDTSRSEGLYIAPLLGCGPASRHARCYWFTCFGIGDGPLPLSTSVRLSKLASDVGNHWPITCEFAWMIVQCGKGVDVDPQGDTTSRPRAPRFSRSVRLNSVRLDIDSREKGEIHIRSQLIDRASFPLGAEALGESVDPFGCHEDPIGRQVITLEVGRAIDIGFHGHMAVCNGPFVDLFGIPWIRFDTQTTDMCTKFACCHFAGYVGNSPHNVLGGCD